MLIRGPFFLWSRTKRCVTAQQVKVEPLIGIGACVVQFLFLNLNYKILDDQKYQIENENVIKYLINLTCHYEAQQ